MIQIKFNKKKSKSHRSWKTRFNSLVESDQRL